MNGGRYGDLQVLINDTSKANNSNKLNNNARKFYSDSSSYLAANEPALAAGWQRTYAEVTDDINTLAADCSLPTAHLTASQLAAQKAAQAKAAAATKAAAARAAAAAKAAAAKAAAARAAKIAAENTPISADQWGRVIRNPSAYVGDIYTISGTVAEYNISSNTFATVENAALVATDANGNNFVVECDASKLGNVQPGQTFTAKVTVVGVAQTQNTVSGGTGEVPDFDASTFTVTG